MGKGKITRGSRSGGGSGRRSKHDGAARKTSRRMDKEDKLKGRLQKKANGKRRLLNRHLAAEGNRALTFPHTGRSAAHSAGGGWRWLGEPRVSRPAKIAL